MAVKMYITTPGGGKILIRSAAQINPIRINRAMLGAIVLYLEEMSEDIKKRVSKRFQTVNRPLGGQYSGETSLRDAYLESVSPGWQISGNKMSVGFFNLEKLEGTLAKNRGGKSKDGSWWKIHEYGSPGQRAGASRTHGFVNRGLLSGMEWAGRHNEGVMMDLRKGYGKILKDAGVVDYHKGVMPLRVISTIGPSVQADFKKEIQQRIVSAITEAMR